MWVPRQTLLTDENGMQIIVGHRDEHFYSADQFATVGSAAEAAQQIALGIIQKKYPGVQTNDVSWHLLSEKVSGFVAV